MNHGHEDGSLEILPLGGLGEIGLNLMTLSWKRDSSSVADDTVLIDCGTMFPDSGMIGAELILPDLSVLAERRDSVRGIVITHGHEDHIGALPYVLREIQVPIYAPPFAIALIENKLDEHKMHDGVELIPVTPGRPFTVGPFTFEAVQVTHSIPDAVSYIIGTPEGTIVFTSDFKIDDDPLDNRPFDRDRFRRAGDEGVLALLSDSTNVESAGWSGSERALEGRLREIIEAWPGRVVVAQFSSNVNRLGSLARIAKVTGRRLLLIGRSLHTYLDAARRSGIAPFAEGEEGDAPAVRDIPLERQLVVCTGSQGEPRSALVQAATGRHRYLQIGEGDLVILSSRVIPGNERAVFRMVNHLHRRGAEVLHERRADVHVSGHAHREELAEMLRLTRPRFFIPAHGEYAHLVEHYELATEIGVEDAVVIENGQRVAISPDGLQLLDEVDTELYFVSGTVTGTALDVKLKERSRAAWDGVVSVVLLKRGNSGGPNAAGAGGLSVEAEALASGVHTDNGRLLREVEAFLSDGLSGLPALTPPEELKEQTRMLVRRFFRRAVHKRPLVHVFII